ncbi:FhaA domain-containing protein [Kineococcus sp. SYSU DK004]|uniref:FhaA domain-containing protein n=1 Tax=Kineococcus sp. SYSU DK004 TaxID=3383125 RepID=UPI003D7C9478
MGVLDRFERGVERAVNGVFARAFRSEVQPVEVASALRRELDDRAAVLARGRTLVPNSFVVELGPTDHDKIASWQDTLADELVVAVTQHAEKQRYSFVGPVRVSFHEAEDLETGVFRVLSSTVKGRVAPASPRTTPAGRPRLEVDGRSYVLNEAVTVVGRGSDADVVVDDPGVSRRHAEVRVGAQGARLVDLGSTNGSFVDGERVSSTDLHDGATVTVGRTRLVFRSGRHDESWT